MQSCDQTCSWCARQFWQWLRGRIAAGEQRRGRSGEGHYNQAASTSVGARRFDLIENKTEP